MEKNAVLMKIVVVAIVIFALTSVALSVGAAAEVNHLSVDGAWVLKETIKDPMVIAETGTIPTTPMVIPAETPPYYFNYRAGIYDSSACFNYSWASVYVPSKETFCTGQVHLQSTWTIPPSTLVPGETMKTDLEASYTASRDVIQDHPSCYTMLGGHCIRFSITGFRGRSIGPVGLCVEGYRTELSKKSSETIEWSVPKGIPGDTLEIKIAPITTGMGRSDNAIHFIYEYKEEAPTTTPTSSPTQQLKISDLRGTLNTDNDCNLYVADYGDNQVKMINPNGSVTTYASGIDRPRYQVFDSAGNLYVGSFDGNIYNVSASGGKTIVASGIWSPQGMGFDGAGNLYVAGGYDGKIHRIAPDGSKTTMDSGFAYPKHLAVYSNGNIYVVENQGTLIVRITPEGGKANLVDLGETILGMATDGEYLYVSHADKISRIDTSGQVTQIATDLDQPSSLTVCNGSVFVTVRDGIVKLKISDETKRTSTGSGTSYLEATLTHSGFDFSEGTTGESLINDGEIIFWQPGGGTHPSYPRDSGYLWWRNANHASQTKDMGAVDIATVRAVPAEWDKSPLIPPLLVGHTIVAKCYDGYVKFQVISVDTADESARVKYWYSTDTTFDEGSPTLQPTP